MKYTVALLSLAGYAAAGGVTSAIAPASSAPAGCSESYSGNFELTVEKISSKRDLTRRTTCGGSGTLVLTLSDGILHDADGRTGYIASNFQFQFDDPPQAGAIYTAGFSVCSNGELALGGNTTWYECTSGTFSNLYDEDWAAQCSAAEILIIPCTYATGASDTNTAAVSEYSDGQPQVTATVTGVPLSEYTDGQPQVVTAATTAVPVSEYTDGQPQVVTAAATTAVPVSEYTDGQPQVVTAAASTSTSAVVPVSEYSDGQPQVVTAAGTTSFTTSVAPGNSSATSTQSAVIAGAGRVASGVGAVLAGVLGAVFAL